MYYIVSAFDKDCNSEEAIVNKIRAGTPLFQEQRQGASEVMKLDVSPECSLQERY